MWEKQERPEKKEKQEKLESKMKWMLLSTMIPMAILIIVLLIFFWNYTDKYNQLSNNLAVSTEYNANNRNSNNEMSLKDEFDMLIYYVSIGRKGRDGLPTEQVKKAIDTVEKLKKTTTKKESLRSLKYLTNYLDNLQKRMNQLVEIKDYEKRQEFMANNTEILTTLFEKEMQNYIYQEAAQLVEVESQLAGNVRLTILTMCAVILIATFILMRRSFRLTYSITKPISEILHNIKKVGKGEYKTINAVSADCIEIQELDSGTRKMAGRIEGLLENVRKEQEAQHMTELQLIQAQVNPHFLYNTLDTIRIQAQLNGDKKVADLLMRLVDFFRISVKVDRQMVALDDELELLEAYMDLMCYRYPNLHCEYVIDPDLGGSLVPNFILQPLVENSLLHGLKNKGYRGEVVITAKKEGNAIEILIRDSGSGFTDGRKDIIDEMLLHYDKKQAKLEGNSIGILNVQKRIKLLCGPKYGLSYMENETGGVTARLLLPHEEDAK